MINEAKPGQSVQLHCFDRPLIRGDKIVGKPLVPRSTAGANCPEEILVCDHKQFLKRTGVQPSDRPHPPVSSFSRWSNTEHEIFRKNGHGRISPYQSYSKLLWEHFLSNTCVLIMFLIKKNP